MSQVLADQAESPGFSPFLGSDSARQRVALYGAQKTAQAAAHDPRSIRNHEIAFNELLLDSARKGRLTSQDASFSHGSQLIPPKLPHRSSYDARLNSIRHNPPHFLDSSDLQDSEPLRLRSKSVDAVFQVAPCPPDVPRPAIKKRFSVSMLLSSIEGSMSASSSRRASKSSPLNSRPASVYSHREQFFEVDLNITMSV